MCRQVNPVYRKHYELMIDSGFYHAAVETGLLIAHEEIAPIAGRESAYKILRPEQLAFVSYPYEWGFSQLRDAALLTLKLQKLALNFGMSLKDASAYNVQFHRGAPVFIDTLSFEAYPEGQPWVGYQQFCKHFLAPLVLMVYRHVDLRKLLRAHIDGIPLDLASRLLPARTLLRPSIFLHIHMHARAQRTHGDCAASAARAQARGMTRTALLGLVDGLESAVRRLRWRSEGSEWGAYYADTNYSEAALQAKRDLVGNFLDTVKPRSVWDLGANTGVFSRIASQRGIQTVALDVDPVAVERNYHQCEESGDRFLLPLIMDLTNPSPALGWDNRERSSLRERGPCDLAMALALVHHIAISNNVPLDWIAAFLRGICRYLIVEFIPKSDSQVQRLLATREDIFPDYHEAGFEEAFLDHFRVLSRRRLPESERTLYLMEVK